MSFYKLFSENDRVVSTNPIYEKQTFVSSSVEPAWYSASYSPYNFVQYGSGSENYANSEHVFDLTFARYTSSLESATNQEKLQYYMYNQFSKMLLGHDVFNNIKKFTLLDGVVDKNTNLLDYLPYAFMINLSRAQTKDRIRQGTVDIVLKTGNTSYIKLSDSGSILNTGGDGHHYSVLHVSNYDGASLATTSATSSVGFVFYEAGVIVVSPYVFSQNSTETGITGSNISDNLCGIHTSGASYKDSLENLLTNSSADVVNIVKFLSDKISKIEYQSVTELNSTIYFCRAFNHEFNYSSNPTYIRDGEIIVKDGDPEEPSRAYITTVGLYSNDNQLLAVAKLSEPILKTKDNELIARVRLDF